MKNLGTISDSKDIITKEYLENEYKPTVSSVYSTIIEESQSIQIPDSVTNINSMLVYHNGLFLIPTMNYTISDNSITLVEYTAKLGDVITFVYFS